MESLPIPRAWRVGIVLLLTLLLIAARLDAQGPAPRGAGGGVIHGRVIDADTYHALAGVVVLLDLAAEVGSDDARPTAAGAALRSAVTDSSGAYRFSGLPPAQYRVWVHRIGYQPRVLEVELGSQREVPLGVALEMQPIRVAPLEIVQRAVEPYRRTRSPLAEVIGARSEVARQQQADYVSADVRALSHGEVVEAVTLGETDLFRALQRIPGVTTRDDYTATLWTRGGTWDQTRVFFDGLQLYNPTHAGWLFSAVNPDAIGSAEFHPGYRSARWAEGTAAVLDLRSRSGLGNRPLQGAGELSPASARLALDGELFDGQLGWMIAGRRTHVDLLTGLVEGLTGKESIFIPYDFTDLVLRADGQLAERWGFEVSSILEWDNLRGDIPGLIRGNRGRWGNRAGQVTLKMPVGPWQGHLTAGQTLFGTRVQMRDGEGEEAPLPTLPALENAVRHQVLGFRVEPAGSRTGRWAVGYQLVQDSISYDGPYSLLGVLSGLVRPENISTRQENDQLQYSSLWGERRWSLGDRLELETGARLEFGDSVFNGGRLRVAPRLAARWFVGGDSSTSVSAGWARTYQYTQDVSPAAGPVGPQLHLSAIWLLAGLTEFRPAARSDVATLGLTHWLGAAWLGTLNLYRRDATGLLIPNPEPGEVFEGRDPDAVASNSASGVELSVRRLAGRWTGSAGVTYGESTMTPTEAHLEGLGSFAAPADVRYTLDVTSMYRFGERLRVGGAYTYGSGVPFTRLVLPDTAGLQPQPVLQEPNGARTPSYASLDLMLDYTTTVGSWQVSAYAQLRNAFGRDNSVTYLGSRNCGTAMPLADLRSAARIDCEGVAAGTPWKDNFERGLPRLPLFGVRVEF